MNDYEIISQYHFRTGRDVYRQASKDATFRAALHNITRKALNRKLGSCVNCWFDAYVEIMATPEEEIMAKLQNQARLKKGCLLYHVPEVAVGMVSNYNITDDIAAKHLARHPEDARLFDVLPKIAKKQEKNNVPQETFCEKQEKQQVSVVATCETEHKKRGRKKRC